jgi:hypothetical protein
MEDPSLKSNPVQSVAPKIYGDEADQQAEFANKGKNIQQIVFESYCKPDDFVRVMNILDEVFYWQVLPPENEHIQISGDQFSQRKEVRRESPKQYSLMPKASTVVRGWNAAKMINDLIKKLRMQQAIEKKANLPGVKTISADWFDYNDNIKLIDQIFLGIENPSFEDNSNRTVYVGDTQPEVKDPKMEYKSVDDLAKELGILDEPVKTQDH